MTSANPQVLAIFGSYAPSLIAFRGDLIADAVARGHTVYTLAPNIDEATAAQLRDLGAEPIDVPLGRTSLNPFGAMRSYRALRTAVAKIRPDVLIAYTIKPVILGARAAREVGVPRFVPMITGLGYAFIPGGGVKRRIIRETARSLYRRALRWNGRLRSRIGASRAGIGRRVTEILLESPGVATPGLFLCLKDGHDGNHLIS